MAETAFMQQYRREMIDAFEFEGNQLRSSTTTDVMIEGQSATFLVVGSGGASAKTRGVNGKIPARPDDNTQLTATLQEWHDLVHKTRFNIFASQGNQRAAMQRTTVEVIGRQIDQDIITALTAGTQTAGAATTMSLNLATKTRAILGNAKVPIWQMDNMFFVVSPAAEAFLLQVPEYSSADFVDVKPFTGPASRYRRWAGFNWICHPELPGVGTASETLFAYHRSAIGHAFDTGGMDIKIGYDEEQDYSFARASGFFASKLLQNTGVVKITHDGSSFAAS